MPAKFPPAVGVYCPVWEPWAVRLSAPGESAVMVGAGYSGVVRWQQSRASSKSLEQEFPLMPERE